MECLLRHIVPLFGLLVECSPVELHPLAQVIGHVFKVHKHLSAESEAGLLLAEETVIKPCGAHHYHAHARVRTLILVREETLAYFVRESSAEVAGRIRCTLPSRSSSPPSVRIS